VKALPELQHCLALAPGDTTAIDALTHIGVLKREAGDDDAARAIWPDVVEKYRNDPHSKPTMRYFLQGQG
jgi:TolA-binding protein